MTLDPAIEARVRAKRAAPLEQDADALALLDEVERLRANEAELVDVIFTDGEAAGIPAADNSPTEVLSLMCAEVKRLRDALADEHAGRCAVELDLVGACAERDAAIEGRAEVFFAAEDRERLRAWEDAARVAWSICAETAPEDCPGPDAVRAAVDRLDDDAIRFEGECVVQRARAEKAEAERDEAEGSSILNRNALKAALAANAEMRAAAVGVGGRCRLCTARPREHRDNCALSRPDLGAGMVVVPGPLDALVDNLVRVVCDCHDGSDLWAHTRRDPEAFRRAVRGALKKGGG